MFLAADCIFSYVECRDFRKHGHTTNYYDIFFIYRSYNWRLAWFKSSFVKIDLSPLNCTSSLRRPLKSINYLDTIRIASIIKSSNSIEHITKDATWMHRSWFKHLRSNCPRVIHDVIHESFCIISPVRLRIKSATCNTKDELVSELGQCWVLSAFEWFCFACFYYVSWIFKPWIIIPTRIIIIILENEIIEAINAFFNLNSIHFRKVYFISWLDCLTFHRIFEKVV